MSKRAVILTIIIISVISFAAGYALRSPSGGAGGGGDRKVLYYIDPMHPSYKSDRPGIAPDCGMKLEPVYADGAAVSVPTETAAAPGTVKITSDRQQLIGVKVGTVEKKAVSQGIRLLGRIAVDETRIYRINSTVDGWISRTYPNATGNIVKNNEVLAAFYSPDFLSAQNAYIFALSSIDRVAEKDINTPGRQAQLDQYKINLRQYRDSLRNLGMGPQQIEEISQSRQYQENVNITSPADGIILARGVSQGQRFEKGTELYRIADLSRVWILADVFENEAVFMKPGVTARVNLPNQSRTFTARVSNAVPQFDAASRTLKVRLEASNPGLLLKPDMFVDVELPVDFEPTIAVPVDAVVDTGLRKVVFVDKGGGYFEPRRVETGWRRGGLVEITRGLMNKERIVVSGTFMIDSESRMQAAAMGIYDEGVMDPVCGMYIDEKRARAAGRSGTAAGATYYFCSPECKHDFEKNPRKYTAGGAAPQAAASALPGKKSEGMKQVSGMAQEPQQQKGPEQQTMPAKQDISAKPIMPVQQAIPMQTMPEKQELPIPQSVPVQKSIPPVQQSAPAQQSIPAQQVTPSTPFGIPVPPGYPVQKNAPKPAGASSQGQAPPPAAVQSLTSGTAP